MNDQETRMPEFDYRKVAAAFQSREGELLEALRGALATKLAALPPAHALSFNLTDGQSSRVLEPAASVEYVQALINFCRSKPLDGYAIDSAVTPVAVDTAEETLLQFYSLGVGERSLTK